MRSKIGSLLSALFFSIAIITVPAPAQAGGLTSEQVSAILSLLTAFGADQSVINNVKIALGDSSAAVVSVDQGTLSQTAGPFSITGSARNVNNLTVFLAPSNYATYASVTDYTTLAGQLGKDGFYSVSPAVSGGHWTAPFSYVNTGTFLVLVYDTASKSLLTRASLVVNAIGTVCTTPHITVPSPLPGYALGLSSGQNTTSQGFAADQPVTYSLQNAPSWMTLMVGSSNPIDLQKNVSVSFNPVPTTAGTYTFTIVATNACGKSDAEPVSIIVSNGFASLAQSAMTSSSGSPTISGTARDVGTIGLSISNAGGKVWGSGPVPVNAGSWSTAVSPALTPGAYTVSVSNYYSNVQLTTGTLTITSSGTTTSSLTGARGPNDPSIGNVIAGTSSILAGEFSFAASNSSYTVQNLAILLPKISAPNVTNVTLSYKDKNGVTQTSVQGVNLSTNAFATATFTGLTLYVPANSSALLDVYIGIASISSGAVSGAPISVSLDGGGVSGSNVTFRAIDALGTAVTSINGGASVASNGVLYIHKSLPTFATLPNTASLPVTGAPLYKFSITADPAGSIDWSKVTFNVVTSGGASLSNLYLVNESTGTNVLDNTYGVVNGGTFIADLSKNTYQAMYQQVPAGQTKTYSLYGTVNGFVAGSAITISLAGDTGLFPNTLRATVLGQTVWSDRSSTAHSLLTADWTNGYLIKDFSGSWFFSKSLEAPIPTATISVAPSSGNAPLTVTFTGVASYGSYSIHFGDPESADVGKDCNILSLGYSCSSINVQHTHTYANPGTYSALFKSYIGPGYSTATLIPLTITVGAGVTPTANVSVSSTNDAPGTPFTVTWSSTNASSCTLSATSVDGVSTGLPFGWTAQPFPNTSGSHDANQTPVGTRTYTYTCTGTNGATVTAIATHTVVSGNQPPSAPTITGPISGVVGASVGPFTFTATDPEKGSIAYFVDWDGNGSRDEVLPSGAGSSLSSGTTWSTSHVWTTPGTYTIRAATNDAFTNTSSWTTYTVTITAAQTASVFDAFAGVSTPAQSQSTFNYVWTHDLQIGSSYFSDVSALQSALTHEGLYTNDITGGFYNQTFVAVKAFQSKYGIEATGFVGPDTRAKLNALY